MTCYTLHAYTLSHILYVALFSFDITVSCSWTELIWRIFRICRDQALYSQIWWQLWCVCSWLWDGKCYSWFSIMPEMASLRKKQSFGKLQNGESVIFYGKYVICFWLPAKEIFTVCFDLVLLFHWKGITSTLLQAASTYCINENIIK